MRVLILHDDNCPKGTNGLRAYWEARDALSSMPPEARATAKDKTDIAIAEYELELSQVCNCGAEKEMTTSAELNADFERLAKTALKVKRDRDELLDAVIAIESCLAPDDSDDVAKKLRIAIARAKEP